MRTGNVHDDWDQHWEEYAGSAEENPAQAYRRRLILRALELRDDPAVRLLDIGSGQGDFAASVRRQYPAVNIVGLELSSKGVAIASQKVADAVFVQCDLSASSPAADRFYSWASHASCSEVLEHVDNPVQFLVNARRYLAPRCRLVITVPGGPMSAFDRHIGHRMHFTEQRLREVITRAGLLPELVTGAGFPFFNLYRLVVILRGERLKDDVTGDGRGANRQLARVVMGLFGGLFRLNTQASPWGWQMLAIARMPEGEHNG